LIFSGEKAFNHLEKILQFGPRITGTSGHKMELDYIESELKKLGLHVKRKSFTSDIKRFYNLKTCTHSPPNPNRNISLAN
jgi:hypothetical protein